MDSSGAQSIFHRGSPSPSVGAVINRHRADIEVHIFSMNHRESCNCPVLVARAFMHHWTLPKIGPTFLPRRSQQRCWWNLLVRIEGIQIQMGIYRRLSPDSSSFHTHHIVIVSNTDTRLLRYYPITSSSKAAMQGLLTVVESIRNQHPDVQG
ncbi:hypothetical protein C8J56DRAFT_985936, partial [Mycena floridula]